MSGNMKNGDSRQKVSMKQQDNHAAAEKWIEDMNTFKVSLRKAKDVHVNGAVQVWERYEKLPDDRATYWPQRAISLG